MIQNTTQKLMCGPLRLAALCGGLMLLSQGVSQAQTVSKDPAAAPFSIKAGVFVPQGRDVRRVGGDALFSVEGDYRLQVLPEGNSGNISYSELSVGYTGDGNDFTMVPIQVAQIFHTPDSKYYYGAGLGIYVTQLKEDDTSHKVKGLFGGFLGVGMNTKGPLFGEVKYHWVSKYDQKYVGGFQVSVGLHL